MKNTADREAEVATNTKTKRTYTTAQSAFPERVTHTFRTALHTFETAPTWESFVRDILGEDGIVPKLFPDHEEFRVLESTLEYREILTMASALRDRPDVVKVGREPQRVITVRLPKCLYEHIKNEASAKDISINQLCIAKLLRALEDGGEDRANLNGKLAGRVELESEQP